MNIGIIGAGHIACAMAETINKLEGVTFYAISSRDIAKALAFQEKYLCQKAYGSYQEMLLDKNIDLVYIATPHSLHYEHTLMSLKAGKNVLCEKAFAVNSEQANEMITLAEEKKLFLGEAFWTRFMPLRFLVQEKIDQGFIGDIVSISANLCFPLTDKERLMKKELAGGALLDLGVYPLNFALMYETSKIVSIDVSASFTSTGVDAQNKFVITFENGVKAYLWSSILNNDNGQGIIYGTKGYVICEHVNNFHQATFFDNDGKHILTLKDDTQITGYEYEVIAAIEAIRQNKNECEEMTHTETLRIMNILDYLRNNWC